jgi:hypothetical protein
VSVRDPRTAVDERGPVAIDGFGFKQRDPSQYRDAWQYSERLFGAQTRYWSAYERLLSVASRCPPRRSLRSDSRDFKTTEPCRVSSRRTADRRIHVARGGAGPILGQYLCPITASRGASWPLPRVRTPLLPIVLSKLRRVRFPSSAFL